MTMTAIEQQQAKILNEIETLYRMVREITPPDYRPVKGFDDVVDAVSEAFGLRSFIIKSRSREYRVIEARQAAMVIIRRKFLASHQVISSYFGASDHGTSMHGIRVANNRMDVDKVYATKVDAAEKKYEAMLGNDVKN